MDTKHDNEKAGPAPVDEEYGKAYSPDGRNPHVDPVRDTDSYEAHIELETTHRGLKARCVQPARPSSGRRPACRQCAEPLH